MSITPLALLVAAGASTGLVWMLWGARWKTVSGLDPEIDALARHLDLEVQRDAPQLHSMRAQVTVWRRGNARRVEVVVPLRARMPGPFLIKHRDGTARNGASLGDPELDARLEVHAQGTHPPDDLSWIIGQVTVLDQMTPPEEIAALLIQPEVRNALASLLPSNRAGSRVTAQAVFLREDALTGAVLRALLAEAEDLADAIDGAADIWGQVAEHLGLDAGPFDDSGDRTVRGQLDGIDVHIAPDDEDGAVVTFQVPGNQMTIRSTQRAPGTHGIHLKNPILDGLVVVNGPDEGATRARLNAPDAAGEVLAVIHAFPASVIEPGAIHVRVEARPDVETLLEMIQAGLALAARLRR
ncbi:MAG: hypothetical protein AAFV53_30285 [Myxococcota bacterium]